MNADAVIFDLFGTLVPPFSRPGHDALTRGMAGVLAVPAVAFDELWTAAYERRGIGAESTAEQIRAICGRLGQPAVTDAALTAAIELRLEFFRTTIAPRPGALEALNELRSRGLRTGLVSNCSSEVPEVWPTTALAPLFDVAVFSCDAGCHKPDPSIYGAAIEKIAGAPDRCLYVGDGGSGELTGAQRVGMHAVRLAIAEEDNDEVYLVDQREAWGGPTVTSLHDIVALVP